jgi:hypothetical protein
VHVKKKTKNSNIDAMLFWSNGKSSTKNMIATEKNKLISAKKSMKHIRKDKRK